MKISDLKAGMNDVEIKAKVKELKEPREVITKFGTRILLTEAILEDDTGNIRIPLWGKQSEDVEVGKEVEITNGFTKLFKGELQLGVGKNGSIKVI